MTLPFINLNGSSPRRLAEGYSIAVLGVEGAIERIRETAPNGRDYIDAHALKQATKEHQARIDVLSKVREELEALVEHCEARR